MGTSPNYGRIGLMGIRYVKVAVESGKPYDTAPILACM